jgi:hypothetical protein
MITVKSERKVTEKFIEVYQSNKDADFRNAWEEILGIEYECFVNRFYELEGAKRYKSEEK